MGFPPEPIAPVLGNSFGRHLLTRAGPPDHEDLREDRSAAFAGDSAFRAGVPRSMKMGTIASLWRYDVAIGCSLQRSTCDFERNRGFDIGPARRHDRADRRHDACKQIAADSIDAVEWGHDISCTVDPGHCSGARYERAAKNRTRRRAFRQRRYALADERYAR